MAEFTAWWILNIHRELNGFSGMDCVKWTVSEAPALRTDRDCLLRDTSLGVKAELQFHHSDRINFASVA